MPAIYTSKGGRGRGPIQWIHVLQCRLGRERTFFQAQQKPHKGSTYHRRATLVHLTVSTQSLYVYMPTNLSSTKNPVPSAAPITISVLGCECAFEWVYVRYISAWVHGPHMGGCGCVHVLCVIVNLLFIIKGQGLVTSPQLTVLEYGWVEIVCHERAF